MDTNKEEQKYKLVAPDGGWGYAIAFGKILTFLSLFGVMHGFALIFNDFLINIGVGTSIVAILGSCSSGVMSLAGLFSNILTQKFGKRCIGVLAAVAYCLGSFFQVFAYSTFPLFVASAVHGAAIGFMLPIIFASFNEYFVEKRAFVTGVSQMLIGLGQVGAPLGVQYLLEEYGFRGCLAILTAVNLHSIVGMMVIQPVELHMKKVAILTEDSEDKTNIEENQPTNEKHEENQQLKPLMAEQNGNTEVKVAPSITHLRGSRTASAIGSRRSSYTSIEDWAGSLIITEALEPKTKKSSSGKFFRSLLDMSLLKDLTYVNILLGVTLTYYSEFSFMSFHPLYLFELHYTQVDVSRIIAVSTAADLVSRCIIAGVTAITDIPPKLTYFVAIILTIISRYAFFLVTDFWGMVVITAVIGFMKAWIHVPVGLIFADYLPSEKFSSGYGLFMFLNGMFTLAIGPFIRYVRDATESYIAVFHVLNIFLIINVITWSLEYIWDTCKKKTVNAETSNSPNRVNAT